jgi:hypothetical protein
MKTFKLQITILTGLFFLLLITFLLYPLLIILAIFMPHTFKTLLYKFVRGFNLVTWLYDVAENTTKQEYEI